MTLICWQQCSAYHSQGITLQSFPSGFGTRAKNKNGVSPQIWSTCTFKQYAAERTAIGFPALFFIFFILHHFWVNQIEQNTPMFFMGKRIMPGNQEGWDCDAVTLRTRLLHCWRQMTDTHQAVLSVDLRAGRPSCLPFLWSNFHIFYLKFQQLYLYQWENTVLVWYLKTLLTVFSSAFVRYAKSFVPW